MVADIIQHQFEAAGLGRAPFQFVGVVMRWHQPCADAPKQPGGTCKYCGHGIAECCIIRDADGKKFDVGNVCVEKTGDRGLVNQTKKAINALRTEERKARERVRIAAAREAFKRDDVIAALHTQPHPYGHNGKCLFHYVDWLFFNGGHTGLFNAAKIIERYAK